MMSPSACIQKAEECESQTLIGGSSAMRGDWLDMARLWRELAGDATSQATTARLMARSRASEI